MKMATNTAAIALALVTFATVGARSNPASTSTRYVKRHLADVDAVYDYIVVGGGTSGLVVANRLTEDANSE